MRSDASTFLQPYRCQRRVACVERRCPITSAETTSCGYGSRIALRLAGRPRWMVSKSHDSRCRSSLRAKRSNPWGVRNEAGLLRCARNDGKWSVVFAPVRRRGALAIGASARTRGPVRRVACVERRCSHAPLGAGPESITTDSGYGFRARCCASPRNDGLGVGLLFAMKVACESAFPRRGCARVVHVGSAQRRAWGMPGV